MALGYAEKLSYKEDVGKVGMPELFDSHETIQCKIEELANLIKESKHLVVFTGAGISTSCGIPDFRGPKGVWTLQKEGKPLPKADLPFHQARPGITHMALVALQRLGILKFVISQNVDGLHLKSGIPRSNLAELHGSSFREVCSSCESEYIRDFEVETIGLKYTGRRCCKSNCRGKLKDTVLDWEDALPPKELIPAEKHCEEADIVLCLGTSLQIRPACNLPLKCVRAGGKMVIVNLQATPKDKKAALVIHARVDEVIYGVMNKISIFIPPFVRVDHIVISWSFASKSKNRAVRWTLQVSSSHGRKTPLPFIDSVEVSFPDRPDIKSAILEKQPFILNRTTMKFDDFDALLKLCFGDGCMCSFVTIRHPLKFGVFAKQTLKKNEKHQSEYENKVTERNSESTLDISSEVKEEKETALIPLGQNVSSSTYNGTEPSQLEDVATAFNERNVQEVERSMETNAEICVKNEDKVDDLRTKAAKEDIVGTVVPLDHNENYIEQMIETEYGIVTCIVRYEDPCKMSSTLQNPGLKRSSNEADDSVDGIITKKVKPAHEQG